MTQTKPPPGSSPKLSNGLTQMMEDYAVARETGGLNGEGLSGAEAFKRAYGGNSNVQTMKKRAQDLDDDPRIIQRRKEIRAQITAGIVERQLVTEAEVIAGLRKEATDQKNNGSVRVTAWVKLGEHLKMFPKQMEHSGPDGGAIQVNHRVEALIATLSDDDLRRLARGSHG